MNGQKRPIALIGLMGAGKSSVARILAQRLGVVLVDLDDQIQTASGKSVAELFRTEGEPAFRRHESAVLRAALAADGATGVLDCGGGVVLDPAHRALLRERCRTVWLEVDPDEAARRIAADGNGRPLLDGEPAARRLAALLAERAPLYRDAAGLRVPTSARSPEEVAGDILSRLAEGET